MVIRVAGLYREGGLVLCRAVGIAHLHVGLAARLCEIRQHGIQRVQCVAIHVLGKAGENVGLGRMLGPDTVDFCQMVVVLGEGVGMMIVNEQEIAAERIAGGDRDGAPLDAVAGDVGLLVIRAAQVGDDAAHSHHEQNCNHQHE